MVSATDPCKLVVGWLAGKKKKLRSALGPELTFSMFRSADGLGVACGRGAGVYKWCTEIIVAVFI